jgi:hypothetical protein
MLSETMIDLIGTLGAGSLLSAYFWASRWEGASDRMLYHILNIVGAIGIGINSYYYSAMPSAWLNGLWAIFGFVAVHRLITHAPKVEG